VGFLLQAREEEKGYEMEVIKNKENVPSKLKLKFKAYKFDKKKLTI
jgi:hypothetical protein